MGRGACKIRPLENESSPTPTTHPPRGWPSGPRREQSSGIKRRNIRANVSVRRWPLTDGQFLKTIPSAYLFLPSPMEILAHEIRWAVRGGFFLCEFSRGVYVCMWGVRLNVGRVSDAEWRFFYALYKMCVGWDMKVCWIKKIKGLIWKNIGILQIFYAPAPLLLRVKSYCSSVCSRSLKKIILCSNGG